MKTTTLFAALALSLATGGAALAQEIVPEPAQTFTSQKTRAEVHHSTKKPFRQKGTGRARAGMTSSPLWRGGGRIFPNRPDENFSQKVNKKMYRAGMASIFSQLAREGRYQAPTSVVSASTLRQPGAVVANPGANVAPNAVADMRIERQGNTRWLVSSLPPDKLFPLIRTFWNERGFAVAVDNPDISSFIVPAGLPGLSLGKPDKKMGQRGTKTCDVILENVRVPAANIIGGVPGQGFKTAMKVLEKGRIHLAAVCVGVAQRILDDVQRLEHSMREQASGARRQLAFTCTPALASTVAPEVGAPLKRETALFHSTVMFGCANSRS